MVSFFYFGKVYKNPNLPLIDQFLDEQVKSDGCKSCQRVHAYFDSQSSSLIIGA